MKTSKRLLSILLMLTMLVSMFTVMASADATDETLAEATRNVDVFIEGKGSVQAGNTTYTENFTYTAKAGDTLVAIPQSTNGTVQWFSGLGSTWTPIQSTRTFEFIDDYIQDMAGLKVVFTNPEPPVEDKKVSVNIILNFDEVEGAKVSNGTTEVKSGPLELTVDENQKGVTLTAAAADSLTYGKNYTVTWKLNNETAMSGQYFILSNLSGKDNALTITFEKASPVAPKHTLTINVPKVDNKVAGTVTYEGAELPKLEGLQNGDTRTLVAEAKDGYEFLKWEVTGATVSSDTNTTTTVKMGDTDATITAKFVKKTAPVDTFKLTVEQVGDHGTFKIRKKLDNGKWGDWWTAADDDFTSIEISNLKKGTIYQIKAVPGTNYEASWKVNNKTATVDNDIYTATINKNDISVKITFTKIDTKNLKLSVDLDGRHGRLKYYDDDVEEWVTYDDEYWTLSKDDKVEFKAVPDSGYKAVWQLGSGSKTSATYYDVTYRDMDGKNRTLHVDFVKKSSSDVDDYPTLTFDITGGKHGTVSRNGRQYTDGDVISIKKNDKMTFKADADKGYVAVWTYKGESYVGDEFTVKMGSKDATLYIEFMDKDDIRLTELPFRDVSKRDWYYDDVVYVYRKGYMDGMSSTRFGGELNTTRGQIVTILWRLTGEPRATKRNPFTDVSSSQYYYDAISWAYDAGVVDGFDAHTFKPDQNVTREQLAAILYRYAEYMNLSTSGSAYLAKYRDADKIANWAYDAMAWANYRGLINGTSATRIDPKGYATRAQIAAILHRFAVEFGA